MKTHYPTSRWGRYLIAAVIATMLTAGAAHAATQPPVSMYAESMGLPFNGANSVWTTPLSPQAPIDPESAKLVAVLDKWFPIGANSRANFTASQGINWWIAPAGTPYTTVTVTANSPQLQQVLDQVPIPAGAHPSLGADHRMAVLQPTSGCTWEFWHMTQATNGTWSAATGGRMCNIWSDPGVYRNVDDSAGNVLEQNTWGGPATGFPNMAGVMMVDELAHGWIPHAVAFAIQQSANCYRVWNQPAERTDGSTVATLDANGEPTNCIPEGARFRLPPPCPAKTRSTPGVCYNVSDLAGDPPIVTELAAAAQTYGLVDENSTIGGVVGVESGNQGTPPYEVLGADPYTTAIKGEPNTPFFGSDTNMNALALFPWSWLELVQTSVTQTPNPTLYTESDPPAPLWPTN